MWYLEVDICVQIDRCVSAAGVCPLCGWTCGSRGDARLSSPVYGIQADAPVSSP